MAQTESKRVYPIEYGSYVTEWIHVTGVKVPRWLITQETYNLRRGEAQRHYAEQANILHKGVPDEDAGDTHGQYHNEAAWYEEQRQGVSQVLGDGQKRGLNQAVVVPDMENIRRAMEKCGVDPTEVVTLGSRVQCRFIEDKQLGWLDEDVPESDEIEELIIVPELEGKGVGPVTRSPISTPSARALLGHRSGDTVWYEVTNPEKPMLSPHRVKIEILTIK